MDGLTLRNIWTVLFRFSGLLKTRKKNKKLGENIESEELGLGEIGERWGEYDQNICMYEISKELIKIFILMVS